MGARSNSVTRGGFVNLTILPRKLQGTLKIPSSKSVGHRMVLAAALAGGGKVENLTISADIRATLEGMKALGADYSLDGSAAFFIDVARFRGILLSSIATSQVLLCGF